MPKKKANGIDHYYEISGSGAPLLLVAGMGGTANFWKQQVDFFSTYYTVITYDQRGTGRTEHRHVKNIDQLADDILSLLDVLGVGTVDFVGHSTGGNIGQSIAIDYPNRISKLVIYASTTFGDHYRSKVWRVRRSILESQGASLYGDMTSIMLYPAKWITENSDELERQQEAQKYMLAPVEIMTSRIEAVQKFDRRGELEKISNDTLVLCSKDDIQTPAYFSEELASKIPNSKLILMNYGGHACSRTMSNEFNNHLLVFLK